MKAITVFCASSAGADESYLLAAGRLGQTLAFNGIELVYGGAKVGLMGAVAKGALEAGGKVTGVLPRFLQTKEVAHDNLTRLIIVNSMHERKMHMSELCDGIIALPGGFGTLEELFEMLTWAQLGLHNKPVALINLNGFYDPLLELIQNMLEKDLIKSLHQNMLIISPDVGTVLDRMRAYKAPLIEKWINPENT